MCFKCWRKWTCPRDWMSSGSMAAAHALQWSVCRLLFHAKSPQIKHTCTHTQWWGTTTPSGPPEGACMSGSIFSNTQAHTWAVFPMRSVRTASCERFSQMVLNASPRALQKGCVCTQHRRGSRADLIVCTSKCTLQHHRAAPLYIVRKRLISALIRS